MKKLIFIYFTFLCLWFTKAQNIIPTITKTYTFGLLKNYYQDVNKIALYPGFQLTVEKNKWLIIHQFLPAQLLWLQLANPCDFIGISFDRYYYQFATDCNIIKKNNLIISTGFNLRALYGLNILDCIDKGFYKEAILDGKLAFEPGLNTNLLYFPFTNKKLSKIGFSVNVNLMLLGADTYQMGVCYKHISKKRSKNQQL